MKNKIAICIPAFSSASNIKTCIDSILKSNDNFYDLSILLYNNSNKQEIINLCKEYSLEYDSVRLFDYRVNRGCSITWNDAIEFVYHSTNNYFSALFIVNDDIEFLEDSFLKFADTVLKNPQIPVITMKPIKNGDSYSLFAYTRFAYEKIGFFDENIRPAYFEDADFVNRIKKLGFAELEVELELNHLGSSSIPENNIKWEFDNIHLPRTKDYYFKKWDNPVLHDGFNVRNVWPFNRVEEKFKIDYASRKKPYKFFSNIKDDLNIYEKFESLNNTQSDINQHLQAIYNHTVGCDVAVSLGLGRGESAFALMMSCQHLICLDPAPGGEYISILKDYFGDKFQYILQGTSQPIDLDEFDVLFIDYVHTAEAVEKELNTHAHKVKKFIFFHDTLTFGDVGEDGGEGIKKPITDFLLANEQWRILYIENNNNGMIILGK